MMEVKTAPWQDLAYSTQCSLAIPGGATST